MLKTKLATSLLATALLAGTAVAQTNNNATNPSTSGQSMSSSSTTAGSGNVQFITNEQAGEWRGSKLVGVDIYGQNDEKVGDVKDILLDQQGNAKAVVIGVGGFLGMGEKNVAVPFNAIQWSETPRKATTASNTSGSAGTMNTANNTAAHPSTETTGTVAASNNAKDRSYPDHGMISMTKDQLKSAPDFKLK
ncbi:photosystem reaction center subunit H [Alsobacter soli]|uniref:Photosystem reaction center subunit H n=1 Tax=Alsobacter soli TaxID=2109933 RepID=A0A2T1HQU5_9HYPH|nr:PRC-barrel domain-containing protein [Alsobacter soli]PSC04016.1 photosystem reaction center subunit H [Alsobacter soli]